MQDEEGKRLRYLWDKKGNPPCEHPQLDKEYHKGGDSGDRICTTCGKWFTPSEVEEIHNSRKTKR